MPKKGYKSLTVHEDNLIEWTNYFERNRAWLLDQGIDSVTNLIETVAKGAFTNSMTLSSMIRMGKKRTK